MEGVKCGGVGAEYIGLSFEKDVQSVLRTGRNTIFVEVVMLCDSIELWHWRVLQIVGVCCGGKGGDGRR